MSKLRIVLVFVALMLLSYSGLQAQNWGLKAGMNVSTIRTSYEVVGDAARPGWHAGVFSVAGDGAWQFQIEGMLSCLGTKVETSSEITTTRILYLQVPLLLKYEANDWLNFQLGVYTGFRLHGARKVKYADDTTEKNNITDQVAFFDYGPLAGVGFKPFHNWGFEIKYNYGIPNSYTNSNVNLKTYNQFWQFSALFYL